MYETMKTLMFLAVTSLTAACSWTQFDNLADSTAVRATERPDGVRATEYGVSIAGATLPDEMSGGKIALLSSGTGNYSTLALDPGGIEQTLGDNEALGTHSLDSVTGKGVVLFDHVGQVVVVDNSNVGTIVAISGSPNALSNPDQQVPSAALPDATSFVNGQLVVGVTVTQPMTANVFSVKGTAVTSCLLNDGTTTVAPAAVAIDGATLWLYTKAGDFYGYSLAALDACTTAVPISPKTAKLVGPAAANGGHLDIVSDGASKYAILTSFDTALTSTGAVQLVNITAPATPVSSGTIISAPGVKAAAYDSFDGVGVLVLGYPTRASGSTAGAGAVDLHAFTSGALSTTASDTLSIPNSDSNHLFGRAVTTTRYNGKPIVVVAADNVVYSFYQTTLYAKR